MGWSTLSQPRKQKQTATVPRARRRTNLAEIASKGCIACPLNEERLKHPKIPPSGAAHPLIYVMGEAPSADEDEKGIQFVGAAGKTLRAEIPRSAKDQLRWNNVVRCMPPNNRDPSPLEIECCRAQQERDIASAKPKLIAGYGGVALQWFLKLTGNKPPAITAWRGRLVPVNVRGHVCWFMPHLHPSYVMRMEHAGSKGIAVSDVFKRDMRTMFDIADTLTPPTIDDPKDKNVGVELLYDADAIIAALKEAEAWDRYGIDLETNGIRPFHKDPRILTCAISNYDKTFAFPIDHPEKEWRGKERRHVLAALEALLLAGGTPIAHNSKFEQEWSAVYYGPRIIHDVPWQDTMAQAFVLDEREGAKSLEAVSVLNIGFNVKALSPPMKMDALDREPLSRVLPYNAYDSKYCYLIFYLQAEKIERARLQHVYEMTNRRAGPLALAQIAGLKPDTEAAKRLAGEFKVKIKDVEHAIRRNKDVRAYAREQGELNPASPKQLLDFFYNHLKCKECEVLVKGRKEEYKLSTEEEVLARIKHPVAQMILELRGYSKIDGTYLSTLKEGGKYIWHDGLVHTNFNHLLTRTGRTSSDAPNIQNFPNKAGREVRRVLVAPDGYWFVATDYGQIEARVIAMASRCPVMTSAMWEGYDIHGEWAARIAAAYPDRVGGKANLKDKAVMKLFRNDVKNQWTFPLLYGSVLESVSDNLQIPVSTLRPLHEEFWRMFVAVRDWQEDLRKGYRRNGYVESLTGRRRHGPLGANEIINTPIQGTASDIVVEAGNRLSKRAYEEQRPQLQFRINLHDDLSFYIPDKSLEDDITDIAREMVAVPPAYSSFITVPLVAEIKIGRNWCDLEEVGVVSSTEYGHKRA